MFNTSYMIRVRKFLTFIKLALFPYRCLSCGTYGHILCKHCFRKKINITHPSEHSTTFVSYKDKHIKEIIQIAKYNSSPEVLEIFAPILAEYIYDAFLEAKIFSNLNKVICIPVPISKKRLRDRGYNQSKLLAEYVSETLAQRYQIDSEIKDNLIIRIKDTQLAHVSSKQERFRLIRDAFVRVGEIDTENVLIYIIDDVITSGATTSELMRTLHITNKVEILAIAH